jgi:hypothetical protein
MNEQESLHQERVSLRAAVQFCRSRAEAAERRVATLEEALTLALKSYRPTFVQNGESKTAEPIPDPLWVVLAKAALNESHV